MGGSRHDFGSAAGRYERWYTEGRGRFYERVERHALEALLRGAPGRALEVGAGTGHWTRWLAGLGWEATGVDVSLPMLAAARRERGPSVGYARADGAALPFADGSFDLALIVTALEFAAQPAALLAECVRCVRPGGIVLVGVFNPWAPAVRRMTRRPPYSRAALLSPHALWDALRPVGAVTMRTVGFAAPLARWPLASAVAERLGAMLLPAMGVLTVARVDLAPARRQTGADR